MDIILPNIGETVDEGKVIKWLKQVGDQVADGDVVCEVEIILNPILSAGPKK